MLGKQVQDGALTKADLNELVMSHGECSKFKDWGLQERRAMEGEI